MKFLLPLLPAIALSGSLHAASIAWTTSPGINDSEVSAAGTPVIAYYFNPTTARPAIVDVNGVNFELHSTGTAPAGHNFNGSFNNPEDVDTYQVSVGSNAGLNAILDGQTWGGAAPVTMTNLVVGQQYRVQFMLSDDRTPFLNARNYDVSDANDPEGVRDIERAYESTRGGGLPAGVPAGSVEAKIFTGTFFADATGTQDIWSWLYENTDHTGGNSGSQINAISLRAIPEPAVLSLGLLATLLGLRRRR